MAPGAERRLDAGVADEDAALKLIDYGRDDRGHDLGFECPGCGYGHSFRVDAAAGKPNWAWNGSFTSPTFSPSLLVNKDLPSQRCHSFVREGKIQFLDDCFHVLRGQTVELPEVE